MPVLILLRSLHAHGRAKGPSTQHSTGGSPATQSFKHAEEPDSGHRPQNMAAWQTSSRHVSSQGRCWGPGTPWGLRRPPRQPSPLSPWPPAPGTPSAHRSESPAPPGRCTKLNGQASVRPVPATARLKSATTTASTNTRLLQLCLQLPREPTLHDRTVLAAPLCPTTAGGRPASSDPQDPPARPAAPPRRPPASAAWPPSPQRWSHLFIITTRRSLPPPPGQYF